MNIQSTVAARIGSLAGEYRDHFALVGGTVRDLLLDRPLRDLDLVSWLSEAQLSALGFRPVIPVSSSPIWFLHTPETGTVEVTRLSSPDDLPENLASRDFTVNAMAMGLDGRLVDPLAGAGDLDARVLRPCGCSCFEDDPLRIFRAFRFEADGWHMSSDTQDLIRANVWEDQLGRLPVERFSGELLKALAAPRPERFFELMISFQVGSSFLPELFRMPAVPAGPLQYHPEGDLFTHALQVLERVSLQSNQPLARLCAMFHDLGKLATEPVLYPKHHGHESSGAEMADGFCRRLRLPTGYSRALAAVCRLHGTLNRWSELRDATKVKMACQALQAGVESILPVVSEADKAGGSNPEEWQRALDAARATTEELGVSPDRLSEVPERSRGDFLFERRVALFAGRTLRDGSAGISI